MLLNGAVNTLITSTDFLVGKKKQNLGISDKTARKLRYEYCKRNFKLWCCWKKKEVGE